MAHLVVQQDGKTTYVELKQPVTTVGRHPNCSIQILDTKASRQHCQIEECDRGYKLVDLQSANGTQVNGTSVRHKILEAGDLIEIGSTVITFEVERKDVLKARRLKTRRSGTSGRSRRRRRMPLRPPGSSGNGDSGSSGSLPAGADGSNGAASADGYETQKVDPDFLDEDEFDDDGSDDDIHAGDATHTGNSLSHTIDLQDRAELGIAIRRLINALIEGHDDEGMLEVERIFEEFMAEGRVDPRIRHLIEDRDMMALVLEINQAINSELHLEALLDKILDETIDFTNAERGFLILLDDDGGPKVERARNFDREPINNPDEKFSHAIVTEVLDQNRPLLSTNAFEEDRFAGAESVHHQRLLSVLCVPLRVKERKIGVLYIDNRFETGVFAERDLLWLDAIGDQAAIAIENARQARALEDALAELKSKNAQIQQLNELLEQKLEARELELANVKAKLAERGSGGASPEDRGGYTPKYPYDEIIGRAPAMRPVFELLDKATDIVSMPVLIVGENGTGKDLAARALHFNGPRAKKPFVAENCAAVPESLFESQFFGYVKGAFTGALKDTPGLFEQADGGTLFLDEVGDLPLDMQKKLLRVLNDGDVRRLGGNSTKKVDVRIIAATNRNLEAMMADGTFREDLYFRLNVINIRMPALRERLEDIPELVDNFFANASAKMGIKPRPIAPEVYRLLSKYRWPGNVRQLYNIIQRIATFGADRPMIDAECVPDEILTEPAKEPARGTYPDIPDGLPLKEAVKIVTERVERDIIAKVWRDCNWKKIDAAEKLGISRPTLDAKIDAYDLKDLKDRS